MSKNSVYHQRGEQDDSVSIDLILTDDQDIREEFKEFPAFSEAKRDEYDLEGKRVALFSLSDEFIKRLGKELFVSGVDVYVVDLEMRNPANYFKQRGTEMIKNGLRPDVDSSRQWQEKHLWNYLEWRIIHVPQSGVFRKGREVTEVLKVLVETMYEGNLQPATRKLAIGQILNALRMQGGEHAYDTLARSQWMVAKKEFMDEHDLTEDEFNDHKIEARKNG